jgi:branched-chain amino acid transport system permease protein
MGSAMWQTLVLLTINGLIWGLLIALIALGLSIIFGLSDVINVAHGDFFMIGSVVAWLIVAYLDNFWLAFFVVPFVGLLLGALVERAVIRPIGGVAMLSVVSTFGLSLILQEGVRATFGAAPKRLLDPIGQTVPILGTRYDLYRIFAAIIAVVAITVFFVFLHRTKFGTWVRAVRQNREMAIAMGIPTQKVLLATFAIGTSMAMFGGVVAAPITTIEFRLGLDVLPFCFMAVIIGGLGNLPGTAVAAILLAVFEGVMTTFADATIARISSLLLMSIVLLVRPQGLFVGMTK